MEKGKGKKKVKRWGRRAGRWLGPTRTSLFWPWHPLYLAIGGNNGYPVPEAQGSSKDSLRGSFLRHCHQLLFLNSSPPWFPHYTAGATVQETHLFPTSRLTSLFPQYTHEAQSRAAHGFHYAWGQEAAGSQLPFVATEESLRLHVVWSLWGGQPFYFIFISSFHCSVLIENVWPSVPAFHPLMLWHSALGDYHGSPRKAHKTKVLSLWFMFCHISMTLHY